MIPVLLIGAGVAGLLVGAVVLRSFGPSYRVGRLLAATPIVSVAEARAAAAEGPRYVAVRGRIDTEDEFEDAAHTPLVLRRARIQVRDGRDWRTVDEQREAVDFQVNEGLDTIGVDQAALDEGLIVTPRESVGTAADVPDRVPVGTPPDRVVRLRVDQVSAVEHAIVLGVPVATPGAEPGVRLTTGMGRPLILTTLERDEAMRILTDGRQRAPLAAALALGGGIVLLGLGLAWALLGAWAGTALAASPSASAGAGGDPRSSGQGPGLVGEPIVAIGLVLAIAAVAIVATTVYVRLTGGNRA